MVSNPYTLKKFRLTLRSRYNPLDTCKIIVRARNKKEARSELSVHRAMLTDEYRCIKCEEVPEC